MNCAMHCMTIRASHQINIPRATPLSNAAITAANHVSCAVMHRQRQALFAPAQLPDAFAPTAIMVFVGQHNAQPRVRMAASFCRFKPVSSLGATSGSYR